MPGWLRWTLLALVGLIAAAAISVAASHLVSQRIGLASEPLSAGRELAPPPRGEARRPNDRRSRSTVAPSTTTATTTATTTSTPPPVSTTPSTTTTPYPSGPTTPSAPASPSGGGGEHEGADD